MYTTTQTLWSPSVVAGFPVSQLPRQYTVRPVGHETDHGFCSVCGAVWPCARARRDARAAEQA